MCIRIKASIIFTCAILVFGTTVPLVSAEDNPSKPDDAELGRSLTPWGAEVAGNVDGTIPQYTGGMTSPPDGFNYELGRMLDPFADEKPRLSITAENVSEHSERLMPGTRELIERWPTFRIDVYPTHRTSPSPTKEQQNAAIANAGNPECKTAGGGVGIQGCTGGTPFPIPEDGYQAMWNHNLRREPDIKIENYSHYLIDGAGSRNLLLSGGSYVTTAYYNPAYRAYDGAGSYYRYELGYTVAPARDSGNKTLLWYPLEFDIKDQRTWSYTTGQRRTRLAPEFKYDTPVATMGGAFNFDEIAMFSGRMDRFDFRLVGKKELYIPYNTIRFSYSPIDQVAAEKHHNPDSLRFELHRVWVVEATLKPGLRHVAKKRIFYIDEDSWTIIASEGYDQSGSLFRVVYSASYPYYQYGGSGYGAPLSGGVAYDLNKGQYVVVSHMGAPNAKFLPQAQPLPHNVFLPESMAGSSIR